MLTDAVNVELEGTWVQDSKTNDIIFKYGEPVRTKAKSRDGDENQQRMSLPCLQK